MDNSGTALRQRVENNENSRRKQKRRVSRGVTTLMYAAQQGDADRVERIIVEQPYSLRDRDRTGKTPLHYCSTSSSLRSSHAADLIVMAAPDLIDGRDEDGFTPLHLAVIAGNLQLVNFLLANNADVNAVDNERHTVVHWAAVCGETSALRSVLAAGAPVSTPDVHGGYPLHYAAQMCGGERDSNLGLQVLQTLLSHPDIQISVTDGDKRTPLLWAASAGSARAVLALIRSGAAVEAADKDGLTALHCAASRGHTDCMDTLLTLCGASTDVIDSNGCTALHYAVTLGHADATALLLAHGADPNRQDRKGRTPAHCGCAKGQFETVKLIGSHGANLWLRNARGDLPLHDAAASGRRELVKFLLEMRPSQVNARNNDGRCPLHMAALNDNADMCKILLDGGAHVNPILRTSKNAFMTPLDCALQRGFRSTAKFLQLHGGLPANRMSDPRTSRPLNLNIRDDVTFYGDSSSAESDDITEKHNKRLYRKKFSQKFERKRASYSGSEKDVKLNKKSKNSDVESLPSSTRIDYNNEIVINGKTEINIHQTKDIYLDDETTPIEIETTNTVISKDKRPRSAKYSKRPSAKVEIEKATRSTMVSPPEDRMRKDLSLKDKSTNTSEETFETVIENKKRYMAVSSKDDTLPEEDIETLPKDDKFMPDQQSVTSEDTEEQKKDIVVEASVHAPPPSMKELETPRERIQTTDQGFEKSEDQQTVEGTDKIKIEEQRPIVGEKVAVVDDIQSKDATDEGIEESAIKNVVEAESEEAGAGPEEIRADLEETRAGPEETRAGSEGTRAGPEETRADVEETRAGLEETRAGPEDTSAGSVETRAGPAETRAGVEETRASLEETRTGPAETRAGSLETGAGSVETRAGPEEVSARSEKTSAVPKETLADAGSKIIKNEETRKVILPKDEKVQKIGKENGEATKERADEMNKTENVELEQVPEPEELTKKIEADPTETVEVEVQEAIQNEDVKNATSANEKLQKPTDAETNGTNNKQPDEPTSDKPREPTKLTRQKSMMAELDEKTKKNQKSKKSESSESSEEPHNDKTHKSFRVLNEDEAENYEKTTSKKSKKRPNLKKERSRSEGNKERIKKSKIPTPLFKANLISKSDKHLDKISINNNQLNTRVPSLPNIPTSDSQRCESNMSAPLPTYYSDNEHDSISDLDEKSRKLIKSKRLVKKRSRTRESRSAGSDYESSNLIDSGFEPSPRTTRIPRWKNISERGVNMTSVTQNIQNNIRKYHLERKIFYHLLELKRHQIRANQHNEAVLVKRAIDDYHRSCASTVGAGRYIPQDYTFKSFEIFLYEALRKLQKTNAEYIKNLPEPPSNPLLCTRSTNRCMHAAHAYTGVPCAAYLPKMDHHSIPKIGFTSVNCKPGTGPFLPNINQNKKSVTLELSNGADKQIISLPTDRFDQNKRYYVTFTVKGQEPLIQEDNNNNNGAHQHAKSD